MYLLKPIVDLVRNNGINACEAQAKNIIANTLGNLVNIGGGHASLIRYPFSTNIDAEYGIKVEDFNTSKLPFADNQFDNAICEQVIEHLHNTTWFLSECNRILKPNGNFIISTENLGSLPNIFALLLGKAPFSTQAICGNFIDGFRASNEVANYDCKLQSNHPSFSGCRGHVRVMTKGQLTILLENAGFKIIKKYLYALNHYIMFHCKKV